MGELVRRYRLTTGERGVELDDVVLAHALRPVEARRSVGRDRGEACDCRDTGGEERGAREGMRPSAGDTPDAEPGEPECVGDGDDVLDDVGDRAARPGVGAAVARPVERDEADPSRPGIGGVGFVDRATGRRAVDRDDRPSGRITGLVHPEGTAVRRRDRPDRHVAIVVAPGRRDRHGMTLPCDGAGVAELADAPGLGPGGLRALGGSTPLARMASEPSRRLRPVSGPQTLAA